MAVERDAIEALLRAFLFDKIFFRFPFHAEGRVGEHVMKLSGGVAIVGHEVARKPFGVLDAEGVAIHQVVDGLVLDQEIGATDGVSLGVVFLAEQFDVRIRVLFLDKLLTHREHAARASGGVVDAFVDLFFINILLAGEHQIHHQADDFARGEVIPRLFVGLLVEFTHQLFEQLAHLQVGDALGREGVDIGYQVTGDIGRVAQ